MVLKPGTYLLSVVVWIIFTLSASAQIPVRFNSPVPKNDTFPGPDTIRFTLDTAQIIPDTAQFISDTTQFGKDSTLLKKKKKSEINQKIVYSSKDSMAYSADNKKIYLYGKAVVTYGDIELKADYIEYDFESRIVYASGLPDTTGKIQGKPIFTQKKDKFNSEKLNYNFKTKKGIIYHIITEQQGGFLHAEKTKRLDNGQIDIQNGKYTTCNAENPHFYLALKEGVMIPNDKIVFRSAYLVIEDVPIFPIFLPFGFFPNRNENTSGVIMPTYGLESTKGYYLANGGYFFAINQYTDLRLTGTIYANGSWNVDYFQRYVKRYKFSGHFDIKYAEDILGEQDILYPSTDVIQKAKNYSINWSHTQDPKANPSSNFNASVLYQTSLWNLTQNYADPTAKTTNTKSSTVAFTQNWTDFVFSSNLFINQTNNAYNGQIVSGSLPSITFNSKQSYYPFRRKNPSGTLKWYENVGLSFQSSLANNITANDSSLFTAKTLRNAQNGLKYYVPLNVSLKVLKYFTITPGLSYMGIVQTERFTRTGIATVNPSTNDTSFTTKIDTIHQLSYSQGLLPSLGISFVQPWYGMFVFGKNSKISKIRHLITPNISFTYVPSINDLVPNYYKYYQSGTNSVTKYSIYDGTYFGSPPVAQRSGSFSFGLNNNLEMKVRSEKDTATGEKKVVLIQSLNLSSGYNIYGAPGQRLSPINFTGLIPVVKNLNLSFTGAINPYAYVIQHLPNTLTRDTIEMVQSTNYAWQKQQGIGRLKTFNIAFSYTFQSGQAAKPTETPSTTSTATPQTSPENQLGPEKLLQNAQDKKSAPVGDYNYFKIPWMFSFNYNFGYTSIPAALHYNYASSSANPTTLRFKGTISQNLNFNGNFSLTSKWKMTFTSAYDFQAKQINYNYTSFSITRDLHCWVMSIQVTPFGVGRNYVFSIHPLSNLLHDLKYEKHHAPSDNPGYNLY